MTDAKSIRHAHNFKDLTGMVFGRWTVLCYVGPSCKWKCRCSCGAIGVVFGPDMKSGKSLGCRHCKKTRPDGHGMCNTPEYKVWNAMIQRCTNPKHQEWKNYGGRGITFCERWKKFQNFIADMGRRPSAKHTLDREKNHLGYSPDNCRWVTMTVQNRNTRKTKTLTIDGVTRPLVEWSEISGAGVPAIEYRLARGMAPKEAVFRPVKVYRLRAVSLRRAVSPVAESCCIQPSTSACQE